MYDDNDFSFGIAFVSGVVLLVGFLYLGSLFWRPIIAPIEGSVRQTEITNTGRYRVYSYDHFFHIKSDVEAYEDQIDHQRRLLEAITDEGLKQVYRQSITGLLAQRSSRVRQYNNDVMREGTRGQFLADNLPRSLDTSY